MASREMSDFPVSGDVDFVISHPEEPAEGMNAAPQETRRPGSQRQQEAPIMRLSHPAPVGEYLDKGNLPPSVEGSCAVAGGFQSSEPGTGVVPEPVKAGEVEVPSQAESDEGRSDEAAMEHATAVADRIADIQLIPVWRGIRMAEDPDLKVLPFSGMRALEDFFVDHARVKKLTFVVFTAYKNGHECTIEWLLNTTLSIDMQRQVSWMTSR